MRRWWRAWGGHVLVVLSALIGLTVLLFIWRAARGNEPETIWYNFITAVGFTCLFLITTAFAAVLYNGPKDRWYIRNERRVAEIPVSHVGAPGPDRVPHDTHTGNEAGSVAHSAGEGGI